jgi:hypothetical protein
MKLPLGFGTVEFDDWARGLIAAFISGGSSAVTSAFAAKIVLPGAMGVAQFFELAGSVFVVTGALQFFGYLAQKPLPAMKEVVKTIETTEVPRKPTVTVTTVEETHVEPINPGK